MNLFNKKERTLLRRFIEIITRDFKPVNPFTGAELSPEVYMAIHMNSHQQWCDFCTQRTTDLEKVIKEARELLGDNIDTDDGVWCYSEGDLSLVHLGRRTG